MDVDPIASLTVHQLRVFTVMADALSLSQAARELDLAPSTVSAHIAQLERSIGARLFDRSRGRRGLQLTDAGELLAETSREALRTLEVGARRALDQTGSKRAVVNLGCGIRFSERLLPALVTKLREDAQDLDVRVLVAGEYILHQQLLRGRLDLCIWRGPIEEPADRSQTLSRIRREPGARCTPKSSASLVSATCRCRRSRMSSLFYRSGPLQRVSYSNERLKSLACDWTLLSN